MRLGADSASILLPVRAMLEAVLPELIRIGLTSLLTQPGLQILQWCRVIGEAVVGGMMTARI